MNGRIERATAIHASTPPARRQVWRAGVAVAAVLVAPPPRAAPAADAGGPQGGDAAAAAAADKKTEQELLALALALPKDERLGMADRKTESREALFDEKVAFVHMGGSMPRAQELDAIKGGAIRYNRAEIPDASARVIGTTAIVLNRIRLPAVVGGNEVTIPFVVTEVYVRQDDAWKLASRSFTRTLGQ